MFFALPAFAQMEKPPELASAIHAHAPYGEGTYSQLWIKAYDAALWTDASPWSMDSTFALTLRYRMHFTPDELAGRSVEEIQHIQPLSREEATDYNARLLTLFPPVNDGDTITALYVPGKGAIFYYNGKRTGSITDNTFAKRFLSIWLSPKTSAPDLRNKLLRGNS